MSDGLEQLLAMLRERADRTEPPPVHKPVTYYVRRSCTRVLPYYRGSVAQRRARSHWKGTSNG
jgi:hypothetical protein